MARWKDPTSDYSPENNGLLLLIKGKLVLRLEELTIAGWSESILTSPSAIDNQEGNQFITFKMATHINTIFFILREWFAHQNEKRNF